jgi:hypothetical protein
VEISLLHSFCSRSDVRCNQMHTRNTLLLITSNCCVFTLDAAPHTGMGDEMGVLLSACLAEIPMMRSLSLRDNRLTDDALLPLVRAIRKRTGLEELDLSENKVRQLQLLLQRKLHHPSEGAPTFLCAHFFTDQCNCTACIAQWHMPLRALQRGRCARGVW